MRSATRAETAFHEAAHAVAAASRGFTVTMVALISDVGLRGGVNHEPCYFREDQNWPEDSMEPGEVEAIWAFWLRERPSREKIDQVQAEIEVSMAGPLAQFKRFGSTGVLDLKAIRRAGHYGWGGDHLKFWPMTTRLAAWRSPTLADSSELLVSAAELKEALLTQVWEWLTTRTIAEIQDVSEKLLAKGELSPEEFASIRRGQAF